MFNLIHSCTVQRSSKKTDPYGNVKETFNDLDPLVPCRLITTSDKRLDPITGQALTITAYKLLLSPGQDVAGGDRVVDIVDRAGASIAGVYDIVSVIPHNGAIARHITAELEKIS